MDLISFPSNKPSKEHFERLFCVFLALVLRWFHETGVAYYIGVCVRLKTEEKGLCCSCGPPITKNNLA